MNGAEQALVVETLPLDKTSVPRNSTNPDKTPQNPTSGEEANTNSAPLHPAAAPGAQQPSNTLNPPSVHEEGVKRQHTSNDLLLHQTTTLESHHAGHHNERSRSRSRGHRSGHRSRSRSRDTRDRSRSREDHHSHHEHHRSHRDDIEEGKRSRGRSPGNKHDDTADDKGHHHHHHHHHGQEHHRPRKTRSRSRSRSKDRHVHHEHYNRKRSRSRSPSPSPKIKQHGRNHHHDHVGAAHPHPHFLAAIKTDAETATEDAVDNARDISTPSSPAVTPTKKMIVRHESTLVALRPSTSPRSFPLSALQLAAEALKTPLPASPFFEKLNLGPLVFGASQAKGMRPYMEDRHIVEEPMVPRGSSGAPIPDNTPRSFAAVYDGHNGTLAADHAADRLHFILAAEPAFRTCTGDGPPAVMHREGERITGALVHAFEATDKEILTRCRTENGRGGATGVVILRIGEMLYAAHCGDSRAVLCRSGEPLRLTEDHKPNLPRERKRVEDLGGRVDFARCWRVIVDPGGGRPASGLAVSRSFGDPDFKEPLHLVTATPDVMSERLTEEDSFVILASDGLWDVMTDKRACEIVKAKITLAMANASGGGEKVPPSYLATVAAQALVQSALNAGTMDNVTAVVGLLKWS
ncbi:hypothetical protein Ndes2526B_g01618 [Nannochloris sp. 'desiccata']